MSLPPRVPPSTTAGRRTPPVGIVPPRFTLQYASNDVPPMIERSPKLPAPSSPSGTSSAQKYLQNRDRTKQLFDSADYFSSAPAERRASPFSAGNQNAMDQVEHEFQRLHNQETRPSALSFEMFNEIDAEDVDDISSDEGGVDAKHPKPQHSMRRGSMEEFFVEENENETVKHAILEKPRLKRWDSGDFYSSPSDFRKMLATQGKDVLKQALDHAEENHRPRRRRRSSLSISETHSDDAMERG